MTAFRAKSCCERGWTRAQFNTSSWSTWLCAGLEAGTFYKTRKTTFPALKYRIALLLTKDALESQSQTNIRRREQTFKKFRTGLAMHDVGKSMTAIISWWYEAKPSAFTICSNYLDFSKQKCHVLALDDSSTCDTHSFRVSDDSYEK